MHSRSCAGLPTHVIALIVTLAVAPFCSQLQAAEDGLVAHYTFDEDSPERAVDSSGNGFHGDISGADHVDSPHGKALRFDGVDDYVDIPMQPGLVLQGDVSIEAWVNAERIDHRNRMIFGDAAGLAVNRNYNLRIDRGALRFEYGSGDQCATAIPDEMLGVNEWHHLAVVCEETRVYVYLDGRRIHRDRMPFAISPTKGASRRIGGWFAGYFKGDIDGVRLYSRALSEREVYAHACGEAAVAQPMADLRVSFSIRKMAMVAELFCNSVPEGKGRAQFTLFDVTGNRELHVRAERFSETVRGSDRWLSTVRMSTTDLPGGDYRLDAFVCDLDGRVFAEDSFSFSYPGEKPRWLDSQEGKGSGVLPPFTPLRVQESDGEYTISCWGRDYTFSGTTFLSQVVNQGAAMLTDGIRLKATVNGVEQQWTGNGWRTLHGDGARQVLRQTLTGEAAHVAIDTATEYDGFIRQNWSLELPDGGQLQSLFYEISLNPAQARYLYWWPEPHSGALSADTTTKFRPIIWLGNEDCGLQWVCESDQHWHPADPQKAVEALPGGSQVLLRLHLVSAPVELGPGEKLSYSFGLHATPVKPTEMDAWDYRMVPHAWYGEDYHLHEKSVAEVPALEYYQSKGVRALLHSCIWNAFGYVSPLGHEDEFRELVDTWHRYDIGVVPYVMGFLLSERAPECLFFRDEMTRSPLTEFPIAFPSLPPETDYITCHNSIWGDFAVDGIARLFDEYDIDGIYLDTTSTPWACSNALHGCGYVREDGTRAATYPVFAVRENFKRLYAAVKSRNPEAVIDLHVYDCMLAPAMSFVSSFWNGEQFATGHEHKLDVLPLDRFRTEFMSCNWGPAASLLYYRLGHYEKCVPIALLHDIPVRCQSVKDLELLSGLWDLRERFGVKQAEWMPYWRNRHVVSVTPEGCYASLFNHPDGRALVYVSNLSREEANVTVLLDLNVLGLKPPLTATDGLTGETLDMPDGTLTVPMPSQSSRTVWVESG